MFSPRRDRRCVLEEEDGGGWVRESVCFWVCVCVCVLMGGGMGESEGCCFLITVAGTLKIARPLLHGSHTRSAFFFARLRVKSLKIQNVRWVKVQDRHPGAPEEGKSSPREHSTSGREEPSFLLGGDKLPKNRNLQEKFSLDPRDWSWLLEGHSLSSNFSWILAFDSGCQFKGKATLNFLHPLLPSLTNSQEWGSRGLSCGWYGGLLLSIGCQVPRG